VPALPPLALALGGYLAALRFSRRAVRWGIALGSCFYGLQLLVLVFVLPAYNQRFALRHALPRGPASAEDSHVAVICYPQMFDSVSFYLPGASVQVCTADQWRQLQEKLQPGNRTLLVIKSSETAREVLTKLAEEVEFVVTHQAGTFTVGWLQRSVISNQN
jgi:hypothetical protein